MAKKLTVVEEAGLVPRVEEALKRMMKGQMAIYGNELVKRAPAAYKEKAAKSVQQIDGEYEWKALQVSGSSGQGSRKRRRGPRGSKEEASFPELGRKESIHDRVPLPSSREYRCSDMSRHETLEDSRLSGSRPGLIMARSVDRSPHPQSDYGLTVFGICRILPWARSRSFLALKNMSHKMDSAVSGKPFWIVVGDGF